MGKTVARDAASVRGRSHVAEVAQALHQVLFVLGAAGALGRVLHVLQPRGFLGGLVGQTSLPSERKPAKYFGETGTSSLSTPSGRSSWPCGT